VPCAHREGDVRRLSNPVRNLRIEVALLAQIALVDARTAL
jgi:hypothetical protein